MSPDVERPVFDEQGAVVALAVGARGAHQMVNGRPESARQPDILVHPDAGEASASDRRPDGSGLNLFLHRSGAVDCRDGLVAPRRGGSR